MDYRKFCSYCLVHAGSSLPGLGILTGNDFYLVVKQNIAAHSKPKGFHIVYPSAGRRLHRLEKQSGCSSHPALSDDSEMSEMVLALNWFLQPSLRRSSINASQTSKCGGYHKSHSSNLIAGGKHQVLRRFRITHVSMSSPFIVPSSFFC